MGKKQKAPTPRSAGRPGGPAIVLALLGLLIVVSLTGLFRSPEQNELVLLLQGETVEDALRIVLGLFALALAVYMVVRIRRDGAAAAEMGEKQRAVFESKRSTAWLQVVLVAVLAVALIVWGAAGLL